MYLSKEDRSDTYKHFEGWSEEIVLLQIMWLYIIKLDWDGAYKQIKQYMKQDWSDAYKHVKVTMFYYLRLLLKFD